MVDPLNSSRLATTRSEITSGADRLQNLLRIGESLTAKVLDVTPSGQNQSRAGSPAATGATAAGTQAGAAAGGQAFVARIQVEGRLIEILTAKPLTPGNEIQITRESGSRLALDLIPLPTGKSAHPPNTSQGGTTATFAANTGTALAGTQARASGPGTSPVPNTAATRATAQTPPGTPSVSVENPQTQNLARNGSQIQARVIQVRAESASAPPAPSTPANTPAPPTNASLNTGRAETGPFRVTLALQGREMAGREIQVMSPRTIPEGTSLTLRRDAAGQLTLSLPSPASQAVTQALKNHLPQQQPAAQLLNQLADNLRSGQLPRQTAALQNLVEQLLGKALNNPQQTSADQVRQQLQTGGTLMESQLARGNTQHLQQDLKALLTRFGQAIGESSSRANPSAAPASTQATATAGREISASVADRLQHVGQQAISRVVINQLSSLPSAESTDVSSRQLAVDIPVVWQGRHENIQLQINEQPDPAETDQEAPVSRWHVRLRFDMEDLPPMGADLLLDDQAVSVIWTGEERIRTLIGPELPRLHANLDEQGLDVVTLGVRVQAPPERKATSSNDKLIDIRT